MSSLSKKIVLIVLLTISLTAYANEREQIGFTKTKSSVCLNMYGGIFKKCVYDSSLLMCNKLADTLNVSNVLFGDLSLDLYTEAEKTLSFSFYEKEFSCHAGFNSENSYLSVSMFREINLN